MSWAAPSVVLSLCGKLSAQASARGKTGRDARPGPADAESAGAVPALAGWLVRTPVPKHNRAATTEPIERSPLADGPLGRLAYIPERGVDGADQLPGRRRGEMGYETSPGASYFFDRQLDAEVVARLAVVESGDSPCHLRTFRVVGRVIVSTVIGQFLHDELTPASALRPVDCHRFTDHSLGTTSLAPLHCPAFTAGNLRRRFRA
jgi:hypothetical protein